MASQRDATLTLSQIAELAGVGASAVSNWRKRFDDFPRPTETAAGGRDLYSLAEIEAWLRTHHRFDPESINQRLLFEAANLVRNQAPADEVIEILATAIALTHAIDELPIDPEDRTTHSLVNEVEIQAPELGGVFEPIRQLDPALADEVLALASQIKPEERVSVFEQALNRRKRFVHSRTGEQLASLLVRLAHDAETILDPAAGEGGFLVAAAEASSSPLRLYGQEINEAAWRIAKQRVLLRGIDTELRLGDSLLADAFINLPADAVLCDPPYGTKNPLPADSMVDRSWGFGFTRVQSADYLWLHHASRHLADDGRGYILLPAGSLFRRGREGELRKEMIRSGAIEAIISLPAGSAQHTNVPLALWIIQRPEILAEPRPVLLIDGASTESPAGRRPKLDAALTDRVIAIVDRWRRTSQVADEDGDLAAAFPVLELLAADADLVPSRWVHHDETVDPAQRWQHFSSALQRFTASQEALLNYPAPDAPSDFDQAYEWVPVRELVATGVAEIVRGVSVKSEDCEESGVRVLRTRDLRDDPSENDHCYLQPETMKTPPSLTQPDDIIVSPAGGLLRAIVEEDGGNIIARPLQGLRFRATWLDPHVAASFLASPRNRRFAKGMDYGYARVDLRDLELPVLPPAEQQRLRGQLERLAELEHLGHELSSSARQIRHALLDSSGPSNLSNRA